MAKDYTELKNEAQELASNLEALMEELDSFRDANISLKKSSDAMTKASEQMIIAADNSTKILDEVSSVATEQTLSEMRESADKIQDAFRNLTSSNKELRDSVANSNREAIDSMDKKFKIMGTISIACSVIALMIALLH